MSTQKLYAFEWVGCILWSIFWGTLAYVALAEKSITLGAGKFGLGSGHIEGTAAVTIGFAMLGAAVSGIGWLFRLNRCRRMLRFVLFFLWLGALVAYISLAKP